MKKEKIRLHPDVVIGAAAILISAFLLWEIHGYPADVQMFPSIFIWFFIFCMAITFFQGLRKTMAPEKADPAEWWCRWATVKNPLTAAGFVIVYVALMGFIGFYLSTILYLMVSMYYFGSKNWKLNLAVAAGMAVFCFLLFEQALSVTLPAGMVLEAIWG